MTYHHLNRLEAHGNTSELTPSERLVAWKIASEIRLKGSFYSISQRTLSEDLNIHRRTIRTILTRLVDLGLFIRVNGGYKQADTFRLNVSCPPLNCEDLDTHNTPAEIKIIEAQLEQAKNSDTPEKLFYGRENSTFKAEIPPNIEKREEEDVFSGFEEKKLLGLIKKTLEEIETLSADHYTLKSYSTTRPKQVLAAIRELFESKNLDTWKRQAPYLKKTIENSPENLIRRAEEAELIELLINSPEKPAESLYSPETGYRAGHTPKRLEGFIRAYKSVETDFQELITITGSYLTQKAKAGTLTEEVLNVAETLYRQLKKAFSFAGIENNFQEVRFIQNFQGNLQIQFTAPQSLGDLEGLLTGEEKQKLTARNQAITEAKKKFMVENKIQSEYTPAKFWLSEFYKEADKTHPHPLSETAKELRLTNAINTLEEAANSFMEQSEAETAGKNYLDYLQENYNWETDLQEFISAYPETNTLNTPETAKHFLAITKVLAFEELLEKTQRYKATLGDTYPKAPQNWLKELLQQLNLFGGK